MTQEEKDLLLKDLCARLPYDVKVNCNDKVYNFNGIQYFNKCILTDDNENNAFTTAGLKYIKPYLFPLSSMTEEQCEELNNLIHEHFTLDDDFNEGILFKTYGDILVWLDEKPINECYFIFDYFNKNHFDYRGLIPMGLANNATGLNIY